MNDSLHCDTVINGKHIVIDTIYKNDTILIEKTLFDQEFKIVEKFMDQPNFGGQVISVLILMFVLFSVYKKWNCKR